MTGHRKTPDRNAKKKKIDPDKSFQDQGNTFDYICCIFYLMIIIGNGEKNSASNTKRCKKCLLPIKGHPLPTGEACTVSSTLSADERNEILNEQNEHNARSRKREERKRRSTEKINSDREKNRKGIAASRASRSNEQINSDREKARKKMRSLRSKRRDYSGWCDPQSIETPKIDVLSIPKMDQTCIDCGALMFPFETKKKKGEGFSFSLCCEYGK